MIKNTNSEMRIIHDNILHITYKEDTTLEIADIDELMNQFKLLSPKPEKVINEYGNFVTISTEARLYAKNISPDLKAVAYIINSLAQRILLRFYIKTFKKSKKAKIFESFEDALTWIKSI